MIKELVNMLGIAWALKHEKELLHSREFTKDWMLIPNKDYCKYVILSRDVNGDPYTYSSAADVEDLSDGYHTYNELYRYRMLYNAGMFNALANIPGNPYNVHKSFNHHSGDKCFGGGWFIVMANLPTGQVSNHYEEKYWDIFNVPEKENADEWDGHLPQEAADRLENFLRQSR